MRDTGIEPFSPAEERLAGRLRRWSDRGVVAIDAVEIATGAAAAARAGRRARARAWSRRGSGRLVLAFAGLVLLAAGLALAGASTLPSPAPIDVYRAVVTRPVEGGLDVLLADADGHERLLRHVTTADLGIDPRYGLSIPRLDGHRVSPRGWLELKADGSGTDRTGLARWGLVVLVDLADATKAPIALPAPGFTTGEWAPDGRYALFCTDSAEPPNCGQPFDAQDHQSAGAVRVFDPDRGLDSAVIVPRVQTFGGGPGILWTADGSGFLAQQGTQWGVTPIDGGAFIPGAPTLLNRWDARGPHLPGLRSADGTAIWQLADDPGGPSRVRLERRTPAGTLESTVTVDLPLPAPPANLGLFQLSPDDRYAAFDLSDDVSARFALAPMPGGDASVVTGPAIDGTLGGLVPARTADGWPGIP